MPFEPIMINCSKCEAEGASTFGKVVNFYDTYANALAHGAAGLVAVRSFNEVDFMAGSEITQVAKTDGPTVDRHGVIKVALDTALTEVYAMSRMGRWGGPKRIVIQDVGSNLQSESSSSQSSQEFSSYSSSSTEQSETSSSSSTAGSETSSSSSSSTEASETSSGSSSSSSSEGLVSTSSSSSSN